MTRTPMKPYRIQAVLFDFDGTLTFPGALDFNRIRQAMGCPKDSPILEYIQGLPDAAARREARDVLDRFEEDGARNSRPNTGAEALITRLRVMGLKLGVISRNSRTSIDLALANFRTLDASAFDLIISRDDPVAPKPSGEGVVLAADRLGVGIKNILMVGDFIFDVRAGKNAGCLTAYLANGSGRTEPDSDFNVSVLMDIEEVVRWGLPLRTGKLPQELLKRFLGEVADTDPAVLVQPGIGEDTAAVDLEGSEVLVLTSDPITFATDAIGRYAVVVNANDMATSGAVPRWLMTTLLFPGGVTPSQVGQTLDDLNQTCRRMNITLCGGHTEVTDAVVRPVVIGTMAGTLERDRLIQKRHMQPGDQLLITKAVAVEGTAIIAREFAHRLAELGMTTEEIERCKNFLSELSVLPEARIAAACGGTSAMHDVTEGGLATAVSELSIAGNHGIRVNMAAIPFFPETRKIARLLDLDPLGLIGSGSLLITCRKEDSGPLAARIAEAGVSTTCIGEILKEGGDVEAVHQGGPARWPRFEVDEITRLF